MSEFEDKLNAILSNPQAMSQVMELARSLGGEPGGPPQTDQGASPPPPESQAGPAAAGPKVTMSEPDRGGTAGLGDLLGGLDPALLTRLLPLAGELKGGGDDDRMRLLNALAPFLKPERREKIQRAAQAARIIHVGKKLLGALGDSYV